MNIESPLVCGPSFGILLFVVIFAPSHHFCGSSVFVVMIDLHFPSAFPGYSTNALFAMIYGTVKYHISPEAKIDEG